MKSPIHLCPAPMAKGGVLELMTARFPDREIVVLDDEVALLDRLGEIEIIFGLRLPKGHWGDAPNLRLIQSPGAGVDWLLPDDTLDVSVVVCNANGAHEPAMPEFILAQILAITKGIPTLVERQRQHRWKPTRSKVLSGGTVCIVGAGTIGQSLAGRLAALGMTITGVTRSGRPIEGFERVVAAEDRLDVLASADVVVVLSPLTPATVGIIGEAELAALAEGSYLVDASRGTVSDLDAVAASLVSGHLAGAAIDVFPDEPLGEDSPWWDVPGLLVTPHTAGNSPDYGERIVDILATNVAALEGDGEFINLVDRQQGY